MKRVGDKTYQNSTVYQVKPISLQSLHGGAASIAQQQTGIRREDVARWPMKDCCLNAASTLALLLKDTATGVLSWSMPSHAPGRVESSQKAHDGNFDAAFNLVFQPSPLSLEDPIPNIEIRAYEGQYKLSHFLLLCSQDVTIPVLTRHGRLCFGVTPAHIAAGRSFLISYKESGRSLSSVSIR